jgi:predicted nucleotidyltransferase component of viral defense system
MTLDTSVHKNILLQILKDVYTDTTIGPILGFKGGTAAYLFYDLGRFSVDLDFDLLDAEKEQRVFERIKKILESYGSVKISREKQFTLFFLLSYDDKAEGAQNVKVEINRRAFGSEYEVKSYLGIPMKVMVRPDMFAHKLVAMFERIGTTNRDIFDVWFFLKNGWPINEAIVEKRMKMPFKECLQKCINVLEKTSDHDILSGMGELLDEKQKAWAKASLRTDTIFLLKLRLGSGSSDAV